MIQCFKITASSASNSMCKALGQAHSKSSVKNKKEYENLSVVAVWKKCFKVSKHGSFLFCFFSLSLRQWQINPNYQDLIYNVSTYNFSTLQ